jgi:FKBP-type peptidyl-prolyl cis-trans isomerase SlyD
MSIAITNNTVVSITYTITDDQGEMLGSNDIPTTFIYGRDKQVIEKIEQALKGHKAGDTVHVVLSPDEGFGPYQPELTYTDDISNVPDQYHHIGAEVEFRNDQGHSRLFRVTGIEGDKLTVDGNHPFAGMTVTYNISVKQVRNATAEELKDGSQNISALH